MYVPHRSHGLPGRLVAVCGADGTGKSTAISLLQTVLQGHRNDVSSVMVLRQPSEWWRSDAHVKSTVMLQGDAEVFDEYALGIFAFADRLNQQVKVIQPALAQGQTVLVDRYSYCLIAYYMARQEPSLQYLTSMCPLLFEPDFTFVLDCPVEVAIERVAKRDGVRPERQDQQIGPTSAFLDAYRSLAHSNQLHLISSLQSTDKILREMTLRLRQADQ